MFVRRGATGASTQLRRQPRHDPIVAPQAHKNGEPSSTVSVSEFPTRGASVRADHLLFNTCPSNNHGETPLQGEIAHLCSETTRDHSAEIWTGSDPEPATSADAL